jgi:hypothetical protein
VFILEGFKSCVLELFIPESLRACFWKPDSKGVSELAWCELSYLVRLPAMYESATFWLTVVGTVVAIASLVGSLVALAIAKSTLALAKQVAEHEQADWMQRKWFDLFDAAENFRALLERFQVRYDRKLNTKEFENDAHELTFAARRTIRFASVFPQNPTVNAFFSCINKWNLAENLFSKEMAGDYDDAIEGFRQQARVPAEVIKKS